MKLELNATSEKCYYTFNPFGWCCNSCAVTSSSNTIGVQLQMIQYTFRIKVLSKDIPSFQRRDWLKKWKRQWGWNTMQYEQNQVWWMWMRWTMMCKMNDMEMNDEMDKLDFGTWNE